MRYKDSAITVRELLLWLLFWIAAAVAVLLPQTTSFLANLVGVGRGVDLAIYVALVIIFYMIFRIFVRLEKLEQDITKVVREVGLKKIKEEKQD